MAITVQIVTSLLTQRGVNMAHHGGLEALEALALMARWQGSCEVSSQNGGDTLYSRQHVT